jgi:hypothetical protein
MGRTVLEQRGADRGALERSRSIAGWRGMMTYGCPPEEQADLATKLRRLVELSGLPIFVVVHRGGGVGWGYTLRGRDKVADRERAAVRAALRDAEEVLALRGESESALASMCTTCGATEHGYEHTPAFCAALVALAAELEVPLRCKLGVCDECLRLVGRPRKGELLPGICARCYTALLAEPKEWP